MVFVCERVNAPDARKVVPRRPFTVTQGSHVSSLFSRLVNQSSPESKYFRGLYSVSFTDGANEITESFTSLSGGSRRREAQEGLGMGGPSRVLHSRCYALKVE